MTPKNHTKDIEKLAKLKPLEDRLAALRKHHGEDLRKKSSVAKEAISNSKYFGSAALAATALLSAPWLIESLFPAKDIKKVEDNNTIDVTLPKALLKGRVGNQEKTAGLMVDTAKSAAKALGWLALVGGGTLAGNAGINALRAASVRKEREKAEQEYRGLLETINAKTAADKTPLVDAFCDGMLKQLNKTAERHPTDGAAVSLLGDVVNSITPSPVKTIAGLLAFGLPIGAAATVYGLQAKRRRDAQLHEENQNYNEGPNVRLNFV